MSTNRYIKHNKTQISKIIQPGGYFCSWLGNLGKKALTNITITLARDNFPILMSNLIRKRNCESRKRYYLHLF